jgi:HEAT repeat protein
MTRPANASERARQAQDGDEETRYQAIATLDPADDQELALLLGGLGDASWRVRLAAVERIVNASDASRALPRLLETLDGGPSASSRNAAAMALGRLGSISVPGLLERLDSPTPETRTAAAEVLGEIQDRRAAPALIARLVDPDPNVRNTCAEALGKIGGPEAGPALLAALPQADTSLRVAALDAMARLQVVPPVSMLSELAHDRQLRRAAYRLLGWSQEPAAFELLVRGLGETSRAAREGALAAIGQQRTRHVRHALEPLARMVRSLGEHIAHIGESCLAALGAEDPMVAAGALTVLGWLGDPHYAPAMARVAEDEALRPIVAEAFQAMGPGVGATLKGTLGDLSPGARTAVLAALARLGDASILPGLVEAAQSPEEAVRSAAIDAMGRLGDLRALPSLMDLLDNPDPEPATAAAAALVHIAGRSAEGRAAVLAVGRRRGAAPTPPPALYRVLGQVGDPDDSVVIRAAFSAGRPSVRIAAARSLAAMGERGAFSGPPPLELTEALDDRVPQVRAEAAKALGAIAWASHGARPTHPAPSNELARGLAAALRDEEPTVRAAAALAIGRSGMRALAPALNELATEVGAAAEAVGAAVRALSELGMADPIMLERAASHPDPEVVKEAVAAAARLPDPAGSALLLGAAGHARWDVRRAAARAIATRGERALIEPLRRLAATEADPLVAEAFADALRGLESKGA